MRARRFQGNAEREEKSTAASRPSLRAGLKRQAARATALGAGPAGANATLEELYSGAERRAAGVVAAAHGGRRPVRPGLAARPRQDEGFFGPESMMWRVNRDATRRLGAVSALLEQVADPLVGTAVRQHSRISLERFHRTAELMGRMIFGDRAGALEAAEHVRQAHAAIHGEFTEDIGPYRRGQRYAVNEAPREQAWVLNTLYHHAVREYERFNRPLSAAERDALYADYRVLARIMGLPDGVMPAERAAFEALHRERVESGLKVGDDARSVARALMSPQLSLPLKVLLWLPLRAIVEWNLGQLHPRLRESFDIRWTVGRRLVFALVDGLIGLTRLLPERWRYSVRYRRAVSETAELRRRSGA